MGEKRSKKVVAPSRDPDHVTVVDPPIETASDEEESQPRKKQKTTSKSTPAVKSARAATTGYVAAAVHLH